MMNKFDDKYIVFVEYFKRYWRNENLKMTFIHLPTENFLTKLDEDIPTYLTDSNRYQEIVQETAVSFVEFVKENNLDLKVYLSSEFRKAIANEDWIKLELLNHVFWVSIPEDISETLNYCINRLTDYPFLRVTFDLNQYVDWSTGAIIEWFVDMMHCYKNPLIVSSLEKVCQKIHTEDSSAVRKTLSLLCELRTKEAYNIIVDCMNTHPIDWIKDDAKDAYEFFQRQGLVDNKGEWIEYKK